MNRPARASSCSSFILRNSNWSFFPDSMFRYWLRGPWYPGLTPKEPNPDYRLVILPGWARGIVGLTGRTLDSFSPWNEGSMFLCCFFISWANQGGFQICPEMWKCYFSGCWRSLDGKPVCFLLFFFMLLTLFSNTVNAHRQKT